MIYNPNIHILWSQIRALGERRKSRRWGDVEKEQKEEEEAEEEGRGRRKKGERSLYIGVKKHYSVIEPQPWENRGKERPSSPV